MDFSSAVSTSTIATAAACLGAVVVGVYIVWGPDFFFKKKGDDVNCTMYHVLCVYDVPLPYYRSVPWFGQSWKHLFHERHLASACT